MRDIVALFPKENQGEYIMEFNYGLLKQRIKDTYGTYGSFAKALGVPYQRVSRMLNNKAEWNDRLIYLSLELLDGWDDMRGYFFTLKVCK